jgi:2-polyprenyl-3-methyl-5-hydroxy-6-metoxy-1,4-benzoquinol methylase
MKKISTIFSKDRWSALDQLIYKWRSRLIRQHLVPNQIICDLGCGVEGYLLQDLADQAKQCLGYDLIVNPESSKQNVQLFSTDLEESVPLSDETADRVISLAVIEHLNNYQLHVREAWRILKPGGLFILTTPGPAAKPILEVLAATHLINQDSIRDHKRYFNKRGLIDLFKEVGFEDVKFKHFQGGLNQLIVGKK